MPVRSLTRATAGGISRSRPIAKPMRPIPTSSTRMTDVRPHTAAMLIRVAAQPAPTDLNADDSGEPASILVYFSMPVRTKETPT